MELAFLCAQTRVCPAPLPALKPKAVHTKVPDTALMILAHGTELNDDSAAAARAHVQTIQLRWMFEVVREAFWKQEPRPRVVLSELPQRRVVIVPFFLSEGYFCNSVIPKHLGLTDLDEASGVRSKPDPAQSLCYARALGADSRITAYILKRARDVVLQFPFPRPPKASETTLVLAGHGTERSKQSREAADQHAATIRGTGEYAAVHTVFLEEEPRIPEVYRLAQTRNIVVVPFFTSDGLHTREDIPMLLGEPERVVKERLAQGKPTWRNPTEKHGKLIWYSSALGSEPQIADLIVERAFAAMRIAWPEVHLPQPL